MEEILPQVQQMYVVDGKQQGVLPLLDLSRRRDKSRRLQRRPPLDSPRNSFLFFLQRT